MAAIRGKDTKPEMKVRRHLHRAGLRYRLHVKDLPGCPDIVLPRFKTAIFVHGCFWHHHGCSNSSWPRTRAAFWRTKIVANVKRDRANKSELAVQGWRSLTIWECEISPAALSELARLARRAWR